MNDSFLQKIKKGYSLLELMVTLTVIGILIAMAAPTYIDHINKGQVADALTTLAKLEQAGKIAYEENPQNTSIIYANTTFSNNIITPLDAEPVINGLYIYPNGDGSVGANQFLVCVFVGDLKFTNYEAPTAGTAGAYSRICKQVTAAEPIYTSDCGALDGSSIDLPIKYLPPTCNCPSIQGGSC